jgi:hypothetical protein
MPLVLPRFTVLVANGDQEPVEHTVTIRHGDQLRAELEAPRHGLPSMEHAPMHATTLWVWCALVREGLYAGKARDFINGDCLGLEAARDDEGGFPGTPETPADPTQPADDTH